MTICNHRKFGPTNEELTIGGEFNGCPYCEIERLRAELKVQSELAFLRLQSWEKEISQNRELRTENDSLTKQLFDQDNLYKSMFFREQEKVHDLAGQLSYAVGQLETEVTARDKAEESLRKALAREEWIWGNCTVEYLCYRGDVATGYTRDKILIESRMPENIRP